MLRPAPACAARRAALFRYFGLTYVLLLINSTRLLEAVEFLNVGARFYVAAVHLSYCASYLAVALLPALLLNALLRREPLAGARATTWLVLGLALLGGVATQLLIYVDAVVFDMFGFHLNGFVWNLVSTPGGIESMGATPDTQWTLALIVVGIVAAQAGLLAVALRSARLQRFSSAVFGWRMVTACVALLIMLNAAERVTYGLSNLQAYRPILTASGTVPFYTRARMRSVGRLLGIEELRDDSVHLSVGEGGLDYPLVPLERAPDARDLNVVWLVAESWRADMLDPEIMPQTTAFAERATWFRNHYSGGNGTRMGMFTMFYGLYGQYWFQFLEASRGPVVIDTLLDAGYDLDVYTSATFTYPEFNRTLFARLPEERMHQGDPDLSGWENDQAYAEALIQSIADRDPAQPFMRFLFFESAHAPYHFPPEAVIREPYKARVNYVTMDLESEILPIFNSYVNACHHLDQQFARVLQYLEDEGLLDSTIVLMTGDHGEEFMEKGHWGHHSTFVEEQTRTPLVVWMPPRAGEPPRAAEQVQRLSSHLDIAPTVLAALGIITPASDYSLGHDLYGAEQRDHVVVSDWKRLAIIDAHDKIIAPVRDAFDAGYVTTADDQPVADPGAVHAAQSGLMLKVLHDLGRFSR